jgi:hypothetical protein
MTWSLVQASGADSTNGSGVPSFAKAYGSNVTAGNLLVVGVGAFKPITGILDTQGNTWASLIGNVPATNTFSALFWCVAKASSANIVTVAGSTFFPGVGVAEFAFGAGKVPTVDGLSANWNTSGASLATQTFPLNASDLVVGVIAGDVNPTFTVGTGFTAAYNSVGGAGAEATCFQYWLNNSNPTVAPSWTLNTARQVSCVGVAFREQ